MAKGERVIAISDFVAEHAARVYGVGADRLRTIPRGVDLDSFDPRQVIGARIANLAREWRLPDGTPIVMLPGRLTRWKGGLDFVAAIAALAALLLLLPAAARAQDASIRQLLDDLAQEERTHEDRAQELTEEKLRPDVKEDEDKARRRLFVLQIVQPGLAGLMDGSVSTLAPVFAAALATKSRSRVRSRRTTRPARPVRPSCYRAWIS